jgi:shikimate dehydrogenase
VTSQRSPAASGPASGATPPTGDVSTEAAAAKSGDRYLVVGNPIAHSRSPEIHAAFARQTGQSISYERLLVAVSPADAFARAVDQFFAGGGRGLNVTLPFKEQAFAYAGRLSQRAQLGGAVNTLALDDGVVVGDNTDGPGLVSDLRARLGFDLAGKSVLLLGAGGAARGVVMSLLLAGVAALTVANRTPARAQVLADRFNGAPAVREAGLPPVRAVALPAAEPADLIVNTTSSGVVGGELALPPGLFRGCSLAYDCVYAARPTAFMAKAQDGGAARAADGLGMLVEQAAESFLIWRGVRPDTMPVYRMVRDAIGARVAGAADAG